MARTINIIPINVEKIAAMDGEVPRGSEVVIGIVGQVGLDQGIPQRQTAPGENLNEMFSTCGEVE